MTGTKVEGFSGLKVNEQVEGCTMVDIQHDSTRPSTQVTLLILTSEKRQTKNLHQKKQKDLSATLIPFLSLTPAGTLLAEART